MLGRTDVAAGCTCVRDREEPDVARVLRARDGAALVFSGTVAAVAGDPPGSVVRFDVERTWKGTPAPVLEVMTSTPGSGSCGFRFVAGLRYLVYARAAKISVQGDEEPRFVTDTCTRTRLLDTATADLSALMLAPSAVALSGWFFDEAGGFIPGATVTIIGSGPAGIERTTTADSRGHFHFPSVPPGEYRVKSEFWDGLPTASVSILLDGIGDGIHVAVRRTPSVFLRLEVADRVYSSSE